MRIDDLDRKFEQGFSDLKAEMKAGFERMESRFDERFDAVDKRFDAVDKRFEMVDARFERMEDRFHTLNLAFIGGAAVVIATLLGGILF